MNILLIEDEATDMKLLSAVLNSSGHRVLQKDSAEQAVAEIKAHRPDLVLLDLKLPGMDGLELARRLKQDPVTRRIPIVAMTAASEKFSMNDALAAGCDAYILKPIDTRALPNKIEEVARHKSRRRRKS